MTTPRRYVLELHDVGAHAPDVVERMLACVPAAAAATAILLVVPNWRGAPSWERCEHVHKEWRRFGAPVVHGYTHSLGRSLAHHLWWGTEREGEFARLREQEATQRIGDALREVGPNFPSPLEWFCPPRWSASEGTRRAVRKAGLGLMLRDFVECADGRRIDAPAIWFDDGARWLPNALGAVQRSMRCRAALANATVLRVALHPRDVERRAARRAIDRLFHALDTDGWQAVTLQELTQAA